MKRPIVYGLIAVVLSAAAALLAAEWIAGHFLRTPAERAAARAGVAWDSRNRLDVILERRRADSNWFPAVPANTYLERPALLDGERVLPLGGVALAHVVGCNENGYYSTFSTDEQGLNNPQRALRSSAKQMFFVGDSFTQGDCLRAGESIVDLVRARHPGTVNLGSGGNGPLFSLAGIREYVAGGKVSLAFWMYYEGNELEDLARDRRDPILVRYLDRAYSQRLAERQAAVNRLVRDMVEARLQERLEGRALVLPNLRLLAWNARQNLRFPQHAIAEPHGHQPRESNLALLVRILATARDEVAAKGGQLVFVYLPEYYRYAGPRLSAGAAQREAVLDAVRALDLPLVDVHAAMSAYADPVQLFPFGLKGHYNAAGARLAANAILQFVEQRGH